jgi:hypothetical protein
VTTALEFTALNLFWIVVGSLHISRKLKAHKKLIARDLQKMLYQDRQIRRGNVGSVTGSGSGGNGSGSGSR